MAKNKYDIRTQDYKTQRTMAKTFAYMLIGWGTLLVITGCLYVYGAITTPGSKSANMAAIAGASFALIGIVLIVLGARNIVATKAKNKEGEKSETKAFTAVTGAVRKLHFQGAAADVFDSEMNIVDGSGNTVFEISGRTGAFGPKAEIRAAGGSVLGSVRGQVISTSHVYDIKLSNGHSVRLVRDLLKTPHTIAVGETDWKIKGDDLLNFDFKLRDSKGTLALSGCRRADSHNVEISDTAHDDLCVAIAVVMLHISQQHHIEVLDSERIANENPMGPSILDELIGGNNRS